MRGTPSVDSLQRVRLFAALSPTELSALCVCLRVRRHLAGAVIFREGEPGSTLVVLAEGSLWVTVRGADRQERFLCRMKPGEVAGEMAVLDPGPRSATVMAETDVLTYELSHDAISVLRERAPSAYVAILNGATYDVSRRLRWIDERIESELARGASPSVAPSVGGER